MSREFKKGVFSAIMGPSGSGKSTLMHCLAGLDRPTGGSVAIEGVELGSLDDGQLTRLRRDKLGFIFQFFNLLPVLSAEENVVLPLSIAGRRPDAPGSTGCSTRLGSRTGARTGRPSCRAGSSSGSRSRALVSRPAVVFADEPTGNLDSGSSDEVLALLREAVDRFDLTLECIRRHYRDEHSPLGDTLAR